MDGLSLTSSLVNSRIKLCSDLGRALSHKRKGLKHDFYFLGDRDLDVTLLASNLPIWCLRDSSSLNIERSIREDNVPQDSCSGGYNFSNSNL